MAKIPASINLELVEEALQDPADWLQGARCVDKPYALFFPEGGNEAAYRDGISVCEGCTVRWSCLAANLDETFGCFGGTTPGQRKAVRNTIAARRQAAA
jgi:hypothetical protein